MDDQNRFRILGRTGLKVGRLGVACSYGAPTAAFEEAFEQGVNYFYWGARRPWPGPYEILTECYRFVMSHQAVDVCMSGPRNIEEMRQALKALQLGALSGDEPKRVQRIGDHIHTNYRRFFG